MITNRASETPRPAASGRPEVDPELLVLADRLVGEVNQKHRFHHVALFLLDPALNRLRLVAQRWGAGENTGAVRVGEWLIGLDGVCGRAFRTCQATIVPDVRLDPDYLAFPGGRTRSELAVPVCFEGRPIGVVNVESPRVAAYRIDDVEALVAWADLVARELVPIMRPALD